MARHSNITQRAYLSWLQFINNWASREQVVLLLTGKLDRIHSAETILPRLFRKGLLRRVRYQKRWVYAVRRVTKSQSTDWNITHGLGCTECLVRIWICDRSGELIPERRFKGRNIRPEWAIVYPTGKLLLCEFCTADNSNRLRVVKSKITRYQAIMREEYLILFVMDIPRSQVVDLVSKLRPEGNFLFTDYETFKRVPLVSNSQPRSTYGARMFKHIH